MRFFKKNNIYKITWITGSQDNILGVTFGDEDNSNNNIEVIEWNFPNLVKSKTRTSKEEVLKQVLAGLERVNKGLGTNYKLSEIYFTSFDSGANSIYMVLISKLIRHYHNGNEFKETWASKFNYNFVESEKITSLSQNFEIKITSYPFSVNQIFKFCPI